MLTYIDHDLCLFDRVNPEFSFKILIKFDKVCWIARMFDNHVDDRLNHIAAC